MDTTLEAFSEFIILSETGIASADESTCAQVVNNLVTFLMSLACHSGMRDRLNTFTKKHDRLIEVGADFAVQYEI